MHLEPAPRKLPFSALALGGLLFYFGLIFAVHLINQSREGADIMICTLRRTTGVPCPTCGSTRAGFALLRLDPLAALVHNPLVTLGLIALVVWIVVRLVFARRLVLGLPDRIRRSLWIVLIVAFLANWAWVLHRHGVFA